MEERGLKRKAHSELDNSPCWLELGLHLHSILGGRGSGQSTGCGDNQVSVFKVTRDPLSHLPIPKLYLWQYITT